MTKRLNISSGHIRNLFASVILTIPILALSACTSAQSPQGEAVSSPFQQAAPLAASPSQESVISLGTWGDVRDNRAVQVSSSEIGTTISAATFSAKEVAQKDGKLVVVYVTLKNTGKESGDLDWSGFQLIDSQGRKYDDLEDWEDTTVFNQWLKEHNLGESSDQLFPGATVKTAKAFRVAPDASNIKLLVNEVLFETESNPAITSAAATPTSTDASAKKSPQPTIGATPSASPTPAVSQASSRTVQAKDGSANLRSSPSTEVSVVSKVPNGTAVKILSEKTNSSGQLWYEVEVDGKVGWLYSELLGSADSQCSSLPQVDPWALESPISLGANNASPYYQHVVLAGNAQQVNTFLGCYNLHIKSRADYSSAYKLWAACQEIVRPGGGQDNQTVCIALDESGKSLDEKIFSATYAETVAQKIFR
ncbi:MAG: SH3 domain-containing protein [Pegethrix bostrychoides GSE-TBD4-15B]|jgi:SH3-like domain-containing protein|uniref:SH3 domain-containing protein n=1 Tax=Pegethrix bostrychoides GSE-TBD4-15B TaxID=2839662 RepID=A0A951P8T4_9CYAN|nr:SH3 domain-containing protein [Pegethrix bostrychoides GSE-TBD4-15B]